MESCQGFCAAHGLGLQRRPVRYTKVSVEAMGIDHFALGDFHLDDFSIDGLGEFGIEGLEGVVQGQGSRRGSTASPSAISLSAAYDALTALISAQDAAPEDRHRAI